MKAQITLGLMLLAEICFGFYSYFTGVDGGWLFKVAAVFVPLLLPATAFLFFTSSFGLDKKGKLRKNTLSYKIISTFSPQSIANDKVRICPAFWQMSLIVFILAGSSYCAWVGGSKVISTMIDPAWMSRLGEFCGYCFIFLKWFLGCFLMLFLGASCLSYVDRKNDRCFDPSTLGVACWLLCFSVFFVNGIGNILPRFDMFGSLHWSIFPAMVVGLSWYFLISIKQVFFYLISSTFSAIKNSAVPGYIKSVYERSCPVLLVSNDDEEDKSK